MIPSDIAGAVLGKGGSTLKELREKFGCKVKMHKDKLPYSDERLLEIPGKEGQVQKLSGTLLFFPSSFKVVVVKGCRVGQPSPIAVFQALHRRLH